MAATSEDPPPMMTAYFEPEILVSKKRTPEFDTPIYRKPADLQVGTPYLSRGQIESGAEDKRLKNHVLFYAKRWDAYSVHIRGSATVRFIEDDTTAKIQYAAKNGLPYASLGKSLIDKGIFSAKQISAQAIRAYIENQTPAVQNDIYAVNQSYVFFDYDMRQQKTDGPPGAMNLSSGLSPGRSVAVDWAHIPPGTLLYISGTDGDGRPLQRFVVAQDRGTAILGPVRVDYYTGTGDFAGQMAGRVKDQKLRVWVLEAR